MDKNLSALKQEAPTDARQVRSRKSLNSALLSLLLEKPFDELTIREITARAGTGYATFFRHFPTKEALLSDLAMEAIDGLLLRTLPVLTTKDSLPLTHELCGFVNLHRSVWTALLTGGASSIVRAEFVRQGRTRMAGFTTPFDWLPAELGLVHGISATIGVLTWWLKSGSQYTADQVAMLLHRMVIAPMTQETPDFRAN
ncbi:TetR family transcriptional regulator [Novosphingobium sp. 1949]|uniref:TetR family transcriptional regulator n=1 Tax=Novosphingobium organovorum TaxID=2930092 RepID=A0ABT0BH22_9SPHN|nr:TetR family transcriptional regulator [Novosphingobium organovorum]MCJ2184386.1 TetR family transcriptional regulator [Novosphingobium organovorum]